MLGLWLAPSRCGGRLRLVSMELCGMVWIGLVNSGYRRKYNGRAENSAQKEQNIALACTHTSTHHKGLGEWAALQKGIEE